MYLRTKDSINGVKMKTFFLGVLFLFSPVVLAADLQLKSGTYSADSGKSSYFYGRKFTVVPLNEQSFRINGQVYFVDEYKKVIDWNFQVTVRGSKEGGFYEGNGVIKAVYNNNNSNFTCQLPMELKMDVTAEGVYVEHEGPKRIKTFIQNCDEIVQQTGRYHHANPYKHKGK